MKILVTGSAGYIGSNLALVLKQHGLSVTGIDSFNAYYAPAVKRRTAQWLLGKGIATTELDLASAPIESALEGVDTVVHLAAQPGISATTSWEEYNRNNILATHRLVSAAIASGVKRFVNIATSSVYGKNATLPEDSATAPVSWYGVTKLAAEQEVMAECRAGRLSACSLRLFSVYGERERPDKLFPRLIQALLLDEAFPLYAGSQDHVRSFTYVGDICDGILAAMERWDSAHGEIFNLGTEQTFTTGQVIDLAGQIMGRKIRINTLPPRPGDQTSTRADIRKISARLAWKPKTTLQQGLEQTIEWFRAQLAEQALPVS